MNSSLCFYREFCAEIIGMIGLFSSRSQQENKLVFWNVKLFGLTAKYIYSAVGLWVHLQISKNKLDNQ